METKQQREGTWVQRIAPELEVRFRNKELHLGMLAAARAASGSTAAPSSSNTILFIDSASGLIFSFFLFFLAVSPADGPVAVSAATLSMAGAGSWA